MQNKSYDRYVELLRAAQLQSYERTSARFVATVGTAATGSWLARNPITSLIASICTVVIITIAAYTVGTEKQAAAPHQSWTQTSHVAPIDAVLPVSSTASIAADKPSNTMEVATSSLEVEEEISITSAESVETADAGELIDAITPANVLPQLALTEIASSEVKPLRIASIESYHDDRVPHAWSISLVAQDLSALVTSNGLNFRATALLESGHGFALGIAVGMRTRSERSSEFAGFTDTIFIIDGREYASKIGQYRSSESEMSFLEAGVAASYQVFDALDGARLRPEISVFAGIEGTTVVLEQSLSISWKIGERFSLIGGVSLREYPIADRAVSFSPQLGLRALF